jgi:hypothetical protein
MTDLEQRKKDKLATAAAAKKRAEDEKKAADSKQSDATAAAKTVDHAWEACTHISVHEVISRWSLRNVSGSTLVLDDVPCCTAFLGFTKLLCAFWTLADSYRFFSSIGRKVLFTLIDCFHSCILSGSNRFARARSN